MTCPTIPRQGCLYIVTENPPRQPVCRMMAFGEGLEFVPRWCLPRRLG